MALPLLTPRQSIERIPPAPATMMERHFTLSVLASLWDFSEDFLYDRFRDEPGVIYTGQKPQKGRKQWGLLRIPESVAMRVYTEMQVK